MIILEPLSARFERALDIFVRGFLRTLDALEGESGSLIDPLNRAEKRGIIDSAENFLEFRLLRNRIAHSYLEDEALEMAASVHEKTQSCSILCVAVNASRFYKRLLTCSYPL